MARWKFGNACRFDTVCRPDRARLSLAFPPRVSFHVRRITVITIIDYARERGSSCCARTVRFLQFCSKVLTKNTTDIFRSFNGWNGTKPSYIFVLGKLKNFSKNRRWKLLLNFFKTEWNLFGILVFYRSQRDNCIIWTTGINVKYTHAWCFIRWNSTSSTFGKVIRA